MDIREREGCRMQGQGHIRGIELAERLHVGDVFVCAVKQDSSTAAETGTVCMYRYL